MSSEKNTFLGLENQCPMCLKIFATKKYVQKHLFENKNKCSSPFGYKPPKINYEEKSVVWSYADNNDNDEKFKPSNIKKTPSEKTNKTSVPIKPKVIAPKTTVKSNSGPIIKISNKSDPKISTPKNHTPNVNTNITTNNSNISSKTTTTTTGNTTTTTTDNTVTNRYTIAVDPYGNVIDIPGKSTHNDILRDNPGLQEQIKQIISGLNLTRPVNYKLPPEVEKCQKSVENILDAYGDVITILNIGLKSEICDVPAVISMNHNDDDNVLCIERIPIPDQLKQKNERSPSFVEIIYRGIYHILTKLLAQKFHFYELTRSKKASDDCNHILKYRKSVLISYLVLKKRLDHLYTLREDDAKLELANILQSNHESYYSNFNADNMPYAHQYDSCLLIKLNVGSKLNSIELHSLNMFYENFSQLISTYEFFKVINPACQSVIEENHADFIESEVKRYPDYKYVNVDKISEEHKLFPDYDYEIVSRDFSSHLIKLTPMHLARNVPYQPIDHYYKRIYADGTSEAPIDESDYQKLKDVY